MSGLRVSRVADRQVACAFDVLRRVAVWLDQQGRRQRIAKTTMETYLGWQVSLVNHLVLDGEEIVGVFSLPREKLVDWPSVEIDQPVTWLRALATHPAYRKKGVGAFAVKEALKLVKSPEPLYLDCVSDFLPGYYQSLGFESVATQKRYYPGEDQPYDITLLRHRNAGSAPS